MPNHTGEPDVLTLTEAARYVRVSTKTLREMAHDGRIPAQKVGREWRFLGDALKHWLSGDHSEATPTGRRSGPSSRRTSNVAEPFVQYQIPFAGFRDTAFRDNHERALHRWVPWIAGFSARFVADVLARQEYADAADFTVLDPFAGVGTTLVEALKNGHNAIGFEINPYAALACGVKIQTPSYDLDMLRTRIREFEASVGRAISTPRAAPKSSRPARFVTRVPFFSPDVERQVLFCCDFIDAEKVPWTRNIFRVALGSVMVGFSNYSYEPSLGTRMAAGKPNVDHADVPGILVSKLDDMAEDVAYFQEALAQCPSHPKASLHEISYFDSEKHIAPKSVDVLITSPPYLNNYHYIRNTRPQMFWLGMVDSPADLKAMEKSSFGQFWQTVRSGPPVQLMIKNRELSHLIELLTHRNEDKGAYGGQGWANYACSYFNDCARFCRLTRKLMKPGGTAIVVIGNNILQGIEFKTDRFFAEIAQESGFEVVDLHEVRSKRTGTSIVNSSVRAGAVKKRTHLYETAVELRSP